MAKELYVGHLSGSATEEDIRKLFSVVGTVTSVHLIINPETREFKRCGYVRMAADVDPNEAVETLDGALLIDQVITVSIARPQKPGMSKSGKTGKFGGPRKPAGGAAGAKGRKAGPSPGRSADRKPAAAMQQGTARRPGEKSESVDGATSAPGTKSGAGRRPGVERKAPRKRKP